MKKRQARKILRQALEQGRAIHLPDGRRASKRAIRHARETLSGPVAHGNPRELKRMAALAGRFNAARRRLERSSRRSFQRAARSRARWRSHQPPGQ